MIVLDRIATDLITPCELIPIFMPIACVYVLIDRLVLPICHEKNNISELYFRETIQKSNTEEHERATRCLVLQCSLFQLISY